MHRSQSEKSQPFGIAQSLFAAAAIATTIVASQYETLLTAWQERQNDKAQAAALNQMKNNPLAYAGYAEDTTRQTLAPRRIDPEQNRHHTNDINLTRMDANQITVLRNKQELDAVFARCAQSVTDCPSEVSGFRNMINAARQLQNPLARAGLVNSWVNTAIRYDDPEAGQSWRRTLVEALHDGKGVCDEQAQLKFYALQQVGFKPQDSRFVLAALVNGVKRTGAHSFVLARINGNSWVLDNQQASLPPLGVPAPESVQFGILNAHAQMKPDFIHANSASAGGQNRALREVVPKQAMTYLTAAPYQGVVDSDKAPFYVEAAPLKAMRAKGKPAKDKPPVPEFDLMAALAQENPEAAASARRVLQVAFFAYRMPPAPQPN